MTADADPRSESAIPDDADAFLALLRAEVGRAGTPQPARDPVNVSTIRNWCDAMAEETRSTPIRTRPLPGRTANW